MSARRAQLLRVRHELDAAQTRLSGLEAAKAAADRVLGEDLIGSYEGGRPDIIDVVLESHGLADLLERVAFAQRVSREDARIVARVRSARRAVAIEAVTLGQLTEQLATLRAAPPATSSPAQSGSPQSGSPPPAAGTPFPIAVGDTAPPATWSLGEGVSIAAPAGTAELAVCSGTIVLHGIGGLGPWAPVLRCDRPLSGHSYVYYGFAGPRRLAAIGANVTRGQPIARVGDGIIGVSTGPHLEIGFADSSGTPLAGATARQMLTLLRAAYAT